LCNIKPVYIICHDVIKSPLCNLTLKSNFTNYCCWCIYIFEWFVSLPGKSKFILWHCWPRESKNLPPLNICNLGLWFSLIYRRPQTLLLVPWVNYYILNHANFFEGETNFPGKHSKLNEYQRTTRFYINSSNSCLIHEQLVMANKMENISIVLIKTWPLDTKRIVAKDPKGHQYLGFNQDITKTPMASPGSRPWPKISIDGNELSSNFQCTPFFNDGNNYASQRK